MKYHGIWSDEQGTHFPKVVLRNTSFNQTEAANAIKGRTVNASEYSYRIVLTGTTIDREINAFLETCRLEMASPKDHILAAARYSMSYIRTLQAKHVLTIHNHTRTEFFHRHSTGDMVYWWSSYSPPPTWNRQIQVESPANCL